MESNTRRRVSVPPSISNRASFVPLHFSSESTKAEAMSHHKLEEKQILNKAFLDILGRIVDYYLGRSFFEKSSFHCLSCYSNSSGFNPFQPQPVRRYVNFPYIIRTKQVVW